MRKILVVVDMQVDFVSGSLGTKEAEKIVPYVVEKIKDARKNDDRIFATKDTHFEDSYFETQEGKNLPVLHCVKATDGWQFDADILPLIFLSEVWTKTTFGSLRAMQKIAEVAKQNNVEYVEFCGLCTDICVIANVSLLKTLAPEVKIVVDAKACAGVTPAKHEAALEVMRSIQVEVLE